MQDAWRAYLEMALGLTEAPRKRAQKVAGDLLSRGGATATQLQGLAEDLMSTGMANREALTNIVRYEVDRALGVVGLATAEEVSDLTSRVHDLEKQLKEAQERATAAEAATGDPGASGVGTGGKRLNQPAPLPVKPAKKAVAKKALAKKAVRPNAMPAAATTSAASAAGVTPAAPGKAAPGKAAPGKAAPAKAAPAKAAPAKAAPAGTVAAPNASVLDAAAETDLPASAGVTGTTTETAPEPAKKAVTKKATAKKTAAKKATPAKNAVMPAKATPAKKNAPRKAPFPGNPFLEA